LPKGCTREKSRKTDYRRNQVKRISTREEKYTPMIQERKGKEASDPRPVYQKKDEKKRTGDRGRKKRNETFSAGQEKDKEIAEHLR